VILDYIENKFLVHGIRITLQSSPRWLRNIENITLVLLKYGISVKNRVGKE
jgi:hypothetical protein